MKAMLIVLLLALAGCIEIGAGPPLEYLGAEPTPTATPTPTGGPPTDGPPIPTAVATPAPTAWAYPCEREYDSLTAAEIYLMTDCFRHNNQYHACLKWGLERALESQDRNVAFARAYYGAAQRCSIDLGYTDVSIKIGKWLAAYESCGLSDPCLETYKQANKGNWVGPEELAAIADSYSGQAEAELSPQ